MAMQKQFSFPSADGETRIHAVSWSPENGDVRAILQITHGMNEFIERYSDFAAFLTEHGFQVVGHDHLGHGASVQSEDDWGYFAEPDGNAVLLADLHQLRTLTQDSCPALPYFMLGHSMGSYYLRRYLCDHAAGLSGAIIMGTGATPDAVTTTAIGLCKLLSLCFGARHRSRLMQRLFFSGSFAKFDRDGTEPERSWLTRDASVVRWYFRQPQCTFAFTLNAYSHFLQTIRYDNQQTNLARTDRSLPLLFVSGDQDPVGQFGKDVTAVAARYASAGIPDVTCKLYPQARHELLNETNRLEVYQDLLQWLQQRQR